MALGQIRQPRDQPAGGKGGHGRQHQPPAQALVGHHVQRVTLQALQAARHLAPVVGAAGRQRHAVPGAAKQGHAEKIFQGRHLT